MDERFIPGYIRNRFPMRRKEKGVVQNMVRIWSGRIENIQDSV